MTVFYIPRRELQTEEEVLDRGGGFRPRRGFQTEEEVSDRGGGFRPRRGFQTEEGVGWYDNPVAISPLLS